MRVAIVSQNSLSLSLFVLFLLSTDGKMLLKFNFNTFGWLRGPDFFRKTARPVSRQLSCLLSRRQHERWFKMSRVHPSLRAITRILTSGIRRTPLPKEYNNTTLSTPWTQGAFWWGTTRCKMLSWSRDTNSVAYIYSYVCIALFAPFFIFSNFFALLFFLSQLTCVLATSGVEIFSRGRSWECENVKNTTESETTKTK